jgi:hypothetical protein
VEYKRNQTTLAANAYGRVGDTKSRRGGQALLAGKCLSGSHSSTDGGKRYPVSRSIVRKLLNGVPPSHEERPNQCFDSTQLRSVR